LSGQTDDERRLAEILLVALDIDDVNAADIQPEAPLFDPDHEDSLGLDSIDALEIALAIAKEYEVHLEAEDENNKAIFHSLRSLMEYVSNQRA